MCLKRHTASAVIFILLFFSLLPSIHSPNNSGLEHASASSQSLKILEPSQDWIIAGNVTVQFSIENTGAYVEFAQGNSSNRIDLEIEWPSSDGKTGVGLVLWSTTSTGLTLNTGDKLTEEVYFDPSKFENISVPSGFVGVLPPYRGTVIRLVHWNNFSYGEFGVTEIEVTLQKTLHEGDLTIDGTKTFVVENCTYVQTGNIIVEDYGKLVFRNAELILNFSAPIEYYSVEIRDSGVLLASNLDAKPYFDLFFTHSSFGNLTRVKFLGYVYVGGTLFVQECSITSLFCNEGGFLSLAASNITNSIMAGKGEVIVSDSDIQDFVVLHVYGSSEVEAKNLTGYNFRRSFTIDYFNSFKNLTFNGFLDSNLTILNSTMIEGGIALDFFGESRGRVCQSILLGVVSYSSADVEIEDSTVEYIFLHGGSMMSLFDSTICDITCDGSTIFSNCTLTRISNYHTGATYMSGNITFRHFSCYPQTIPVGVRPWTDGNVTRNFNVVTACAGNKSVTDIEFRLCDQNNTVLWTALADAIGQIDFNCTFNDINNTDTLRLEAIKGNYSTTMNIGLLSDTPVILTLAYFADLNADGTVNIIDITIVAAAYKSREGDFNWNSLADIDKNGEVNILDISMVAKDFGKTV
jgi:hypothetical protein